MRNKRRNPEQGLRLMERTSKRDLCDRDLVGSVRVEHKMRSDKRSQRGVRPVTAFLGYQPYAPAMNCRLQGYEIQKDNNNNIVIRITPELAKDVADAIDHGLDLRVANAKAVDALSDAIHELTGDA